MIVINFKIQDGEYEYTDWDYDTNFSEADYDKGKVTDFDLLQNMYGVEEDDLEDTNSYWIRDRLVSVYSVQDIDQDTLDILRRYA